VPQPPQNSPLLGSAAPQLVQKAFPDEVLPREAGMAFALFAPNLRTILTMSMAAIKRRINPRKLSPGISQFSKQSPCYSSIGTDGGTE
jgi:hypothetical protein